MLKINKSENKNNYAKQKQKEPLINDKYLSIGNKMQLNHADLDYAEIEDVIFHLKKYSIS